VQVRGEGGIGVGASVGGAIVIVVLGDCSPLGNGELLFQVTSDGLLLLPSKGGAIQGLTCGNDESLLRSLRDNRCGLSCGRDILLLPLRGDGSGSLLLINGEVGGAARHGQQDGGGLGWWWWATTNRRVRSEMSVSEEIINDSAYHVGERYAAKS
jgi:hypothetical protein